MSLQQVKTEDIRVFFKSAFEKAGYTPSRVGRFCKTAERLHEYLVANKAEFYTPELGNSFIQMEQLLNVVGNVAIKTDRRAIEVLHLIIAGKPIFLRSKSAVKPYPGEIGDMAKMFLKHYETVFRSAPRSLDRYAYVLSPFSVYCHMKGITLQSIGYGGIVGYMSSRQNLDSKTTSVLRIFFRYLYDNSLIHKDYSQEIVDIKPRRREKLPSFYGKDEILAIERSIERSSPKGKRNYAIVKLASRLGLRASDIAELEFSNIEWEKNIIRVKQKKTGKIIELPLLADVGNAMIDYIENGRPKDDRKTIFLSYISPHRTLTSQSISNIISTIIVNAGIDIKGRRHGSHCLRHSLAYNMLDNGCTLGVISNALGHASVESTMSYMGIDIGGLMACALVVPPVAPSFYNQKGGLLYD